MIKQKYRTIRPKPTYFPPTRHQQQQQHVTVHTSLTEERARKRGLTVEEYTKRVGLVSAAWRASHWQIGDTGMPYHKKDQATYGKCIVVGICKHYDDWGDVEFDEKNLYLLAVSPLKDRSQTINCTAGWLVKEHAVVEVEGDSC